MSTVISVENLGKKYTISHQQHGDNSSLREVITNSVTSFGSKLIKPFRSNLAPRNLSGVEAGPLPLDPAVEDFWALKDVTFDVKQGERIGIIGRNGAGKSTLLKILSRITEPTTGRVRIKGRVSSLLEVGTGFHPELTGRENIYLNGAILGMGRQEINRKFDEIVAFAEIEKFLDTPVKRYSSGMYVRLAFAVAAHLEPEILIVDEVLAVGDAQFQKKCLGKMEDVGREGRTVLFVSHNMTAINRLCTGAVLLDRGKVQENGATQHVVSTYLNNGGRLEAKSYFDRIPSSPVQYVSACVSNVDGNPTTLILEDKGFCITLEIEVFENTPNIYFGLILLDSEGTEVLFADSRDSEYTLQSRLVKGKYIITLKFPAIFRPSVYSVSLGIASTETLKQYHVIDSACSFEIIQNSNMQRNAKRPGLVNLRMSWLETKQD